MSLETLLCSENLTKDLEHDRQVLLPLCYIPSPYLIFFSIILKWFPDNIIYKMYYICIKICSLCGDFSLFSSVSKHHNIKIMETKTFIILE